MRVLAAPAFSEKTRSLPTSERSALSQFLAQLETSTKENLLAGSGRAVVTASTGGVYVATAGKARIFFSFGRDASGDYVVLLDVFPYDATFTPSTGAPGTKNPRVNGR